MFSYYWLPGFANRSISLTVWRQNAHHLARVLVFRVTLWWRKNPKTQNATTTHYSMSCDVTRATSAAQRVYRSNELSALACSLTQTQQWICKSSGYEKYNNQYLAGGIKTFSTLFAFYVNILLFAVFLALSFPRSFIQWRMWRRKVCGDSMRCDAMRWWRWHEKGWWLRWQPTISENKKVAKRQVWISTSPS